MIQFRQEIRKQLQNFNLEEALILSDKLHNYESHGNDLTLQEERLWKSLTYTIEIQRSKL